MSYRICESFSTVSSGSGLNLAARDLPSQDSGSHFVSQTLDFWQNDTQLYFVGFSVFGESKEIFQRFHSNNTLDTLNIVKKNDVLLCQYMRLE